MTAMKVFVRRAVTIGIPITTRKHEPAPETKPPVDRKLDKMPSLISIVAIAVLSLAISGVTRADVVFSEDFDSGPIDTGVWTLASGGNTDDGPVWGGATYIWGGQGASATITLEDLGGGDFAAKLDAVGSGSWYSPCGLFSIPTFKRVEAVKVTFKAWASATPGNIYSLMAPWYSALPPNNMTENIEAASTKAPENGGSKFTEGAFDTGPLTPLFNFTVEEWPTSKATAFWIRCMLGWPNGAKFEVSTDQGGSYQVVADTIGLGGGNAADVILGFGQGNGIQFYDDIVVETTVGGPTPTPGPTPGSGAYIEEHWDSGIFDPGIWLVGFHEPPGVIEVIEVIDGGGGDFCMRVAPGQSWYAGSYFYSVNSYPRGRNLRCTFTCWADPQPSDANGVYGIFGPWHEDNTQLPHVNMEAMAGFQYDQIKWVEKGDPFGPQNNYPDSPRIDNLNDEGFIPGENNSKATGVMIRVWLGNSRGGRLEYSNDGGATWTVGTGTDTIGTGPSDSAFAYAGFSGVSGGMCFDDILVEDDDRLAGPLVNEARDWLLLE